MATPRRRRVSAPVRFLMWAVGIVVGLVVVIGAIAAFTLFSIARDLNHAKSMIDSAAIEIQDGRLNDARTHLSAAEEVLTSANGRLYNQMQFDLLQWVPGVEENLSSLQNSVSLGLQLVHGGGQLLELTRPLENSQGKLEVAMKHGAIPLPTIERAQLESADLAAILPGPGERPSSRLLVGPVADLQKRLVDEAIKRRSELDNVSRALSILADMSGGNGPRRYLIAVANTAEMRGAGGMILSYGVLESADGTFKLGDFGSIDDLFLDDPVDPASLDLPSDYLARWSGLEPTRLWRNTTLSPDFKFDAPVMEAMFTAKTQLPVDGVIQIDPAGLAAILEGTGPVDVPEVGRVSATNVVDLTINRAYIDFPNRDQRQEISADVAKAAFHALIDGEFGSLRPFGTALFKAAAGRHLIFYANSALTEAQVQFFGADGALPAPDLRDAALLTVQNVGRNKLDYYLDTSVSLSGQRAVGVPGTVTATVTVANTTPPDIASTYVTGIESRGSPYALYRGIVSLYLPTGTTLVASEGSDRPATLVTEAGRTLVTYDVELPAGTSSIVTLRLNLVPRPPGPYAFTAVPVGRVRSTALSVDLDLGDGRRVKRAMSPLEKLTIIGPATTGTNG